MNVLLSSYAARRGAIALRTTLILLTTILLGSPGSAQIEFYFSGKGGTTSKLVSDVDTSSTWTAEYDIIAENKGSAPVSFDSANLFIAYASATSQTVGAQPIAGTDKITMFVPGATSAPTSNPNIIIRAAWFTGNFSCSFRGGAGANGLVRPYGFVIPVDMALGGSQSIAPGQSIYICTVKVKDNGCYGNAPYHDLFLYDSGTGGIGTYLVSGATRYRDPNWQVDSRLRIMCGLMLPPSVWRVATVGDTAPGLGQTITALHPPVSSHNGKLDFVMRVTGSNTWAKWRDGSPWQAGAGPYDTRAAINGLGRVAAVNPGLAPSGYVTVDWTSWSIPANFISGFNFPQMPSQLANTVAFVTGDFSVQGVATTNVGSGIVSPYFNTNRSIPGYFSVVQVRDYDLSDNMNRGIFDVLLFGPRAAIVVDDQNPGGEQVLAAVNDPTGIGSSVWTSVWNPVINVGGDTAFCAASNGAAAQDKFIVINGTIAIKEGDVIDGVSLSGFEPVGIDISNDGYMIHTWQSGTRKVTFVGGLYAPLNSRVLLDTAGFINLECNVTTLTDIKGRPTIGDNLDLAVLCTLTGGVDVIVRSTLNCLADFNGDCLIDIGDFALFSAAYGSQQGGSGWESLYDLNVDGFVDIADFAIFSSVYGTNVP